MSESEGWRPRTRFALLLIGALALIVQCRYVVTIPPARTFETSIIEAYPLLHWISFTVVLLVVILLLGDAGQRSDLRLGAPVVLLILNYGLFFLLPIFRGYRLYGRGTDDSLVHTGAAREVIATGALPDNVFYPLLHVILAELSFVGIRVENGFPVLTLVVTFIYILGVGTMIDVLTADRNGLAYGMLAAIPLLYAPFSYASVPAVLSFLLFPVAAALLESTRRTCLGRHFFLLLVLAAGILLFHPVTSLLFVVLILTTTVTGLAYNVLTDTELQPASAASGFALLPMWFEWYIRFRETKYLIQRVTKSFVEGRESIAASEVQEAGGAQLSILQLGIRFVQLYGAVGLYGAAAGCVLLYNWWNRRQSGISYLWSYLSVQFVVGAAIAALFHVVYLVAFNPIRVSRYLILFCVSIVATFATVQDHDISDFLKAAVVVVVLASAVLGAMGSYGPNKHLTHAESAGIEFTTKEKAPAYRIYSHKISYKADIYATESDESQTTGKTFSIPRYQIPTHLGYTSNETARETFGQGYVVTKTFDTAAPNASYFYPEQRPTKFTYDRSDISRLQQDRTVHRVYSNGGYELWLVPSANVTAGN